MLDTVLVPLYIRLLRDGEQEVVYTSIRTLQNFQRLVKNENIEAIFRLLIENFENSNEQVQIEIICSLSTLLQRIPFQVVQQTLFIDLISTQIRIKKNQTKIAAMQCLVRIIKQYGTENVPQFAQIY